MPGTRCAVASCNNSLIKTKQQNLDISYHSFPKNEETFKAWVTACNRLDPWHPRTSTICSQHFTEEDFVLDFRPQLMNIKTKRKLLPNAVPTLLLIREKTEMKSNKEKNPNYSKPRSRKSNNRKKIEKTRNSILEDLLTIHNYASNPNDEKIEDSSCRRYRKLLQEHEILKEKYKLLKFAFNRQQKRLKRLIGYLQTTRGMKREIITIKFKK